MKIILAPMEGVVDHILRAQLTKLGGIDRCVTEFIRVTDRPKTRSEIRSHCPELLTDGKTVSKVPVYCQFLGGRPDPIAESAQLAAEMGAPGIDLNFGCPAPTVNRHDGGAALLREPHRIFNITASVRKALPTNVPLTVKVRLGFQDKSLFLDIAHAAEGGGAKELTVHARTKLEMYTPPAHWEYIARIREALKINVIANGEMWNKEDIERCLRVTGCEDIMLGRGLISRPDLASGINNTQNVLWQWDQARDWLLETLSLYETSTGPRRALARGKQLLRYLSRSYDAAAKAFESAKRAQEFQDFTDELQSSCDFRRVFSEEDKMTACELEQNR